MKTKVLLVRHGETGWAETQRYSGRVDIPLSQKGISQIESLALMLNKEKIDVCYSSTLSRSIDSARIITHYHPNIDVIPRQDLVEMDYGVWDGLYREEIEKKYAHDWTAWIKDPGASAPTQGETVYQVAARVVPAFFQICHQWAGKNVLIVAHKTVNRILIAHALGIAIRDYRRKVFQQASAFNILMVDDFDIDVVLLNGMPSSSGNS